MVTAMMIQTERPQEKRLRRYGLQLITSFWDEHTVRRRASDGSVRDDIKSGVILNKKYYRQGKLLHTETMFSPLMQYSFVVNDKLEKDAQCPNCGWKGKTSDFLNGCPYCGACYHITYADHQAASKLFAEKKAKQPLRYLLLLLLCLGICIGLCVLGVRLTSRTFGLFDVLKGLGFGAAFGLTAFYCVYTRSVRMITKKAEENFRRQSAMLTELEQGLKEKGVSLSGLFTSLSTEMALKIFDDEEQAYHDIVDWDILDYDDCRITGDGEDGAEIHIGMSLRILRLRNDRLRSRETKAHAVMKANAVRYDPLQQGKAVIHCHACGSSIDLMQPVCGYCGTPIRFRQPLYLTQLSIDDVP